MTTPPSPSSPCTVIGRNKPFCCRLAGISPCGTHLKCNNGKFPRSYSNKHCPSHAVIYKHTVSITWPSQWFYFALFLFLTYHVERIVFKNEKCVYWVCVYTNAQNAFLFFEAALVALIIVDIAFSCRWFYISCLYQLLVQVMPNPKTSRGRYTAGI